MYRFLATPKWIVGIAVAFVAVVAFVNLGFWQLSRLEERRTFNSTLTTRLAEPPTGLSAVAADPRGQAYRRVAVTGVFVPEREVLLAARTHDGRAGHHVLTPLRTPDGTVIVDRGWVPLELTDPPIAEAAPPPGEVTVAGVVFPGQTARRAGAFGDGEELEFVSAVDLERLGEWVGEPLVPAYVQSQRQTPAGGDLPLPAALPAVEEGNHLSYAVQWFLFAGVVAVGFPLLVRRTAREREGQPPRVGTAA